MAILCGAKITKFSIFEAYMNYDGGVFTETSLSLFNIAGMLFQAKKTQLTKSVIAPNTTIQGAIPEDTINFDTSSSAGAMSNKYNIGTKIHEPIAPIGITKAIKEKGIK